MKPVAIVVLLFSLLSGGCGSGSSGSAQVGNGQVDNGDSSAQEGVTDIGQTDNGTTTGGTTDGDTTVDGAVDGTGDQSGDGGQEQSPDNKASADSTRPNVILVITDDQGLDASAQFSLSNDLPVTPVIDSLAASGITYENVWATPSCTTTRAALLTGKHGVNNGVTSTPGILSSSAGTIQQYLQQNAPEYQTAVFGKWHVAGGNPDPNHPQSLGVGHYSGNLTGNLSDYNDWTVTTNGVAAQSTQYHTSALVDFAINWIAEQSNPWFTWLAFSAPHSPFHVPPEAFNRRNLSATAADIDANRREYYLAAIETLDTELGRLLDSLDSDVRDNTIVMVIGDNGTPRTVIDRSAYIGSHGKGTLFNGGVHVPMVVSGYGVERSNVRESGLVSIVDFFPTIAALATGDVSNAGGAQAAIDGVSFLSSFSAANTIARDFLYTEYVSDEALGSGWTVRSDTYKHLSYTDGSEALYDLSADSDEATNLVGTSGVPAALAGIRQELRNFGLAIRNETPDASAPIDITDEVLINRGGDCADHVNNYISSATDAGTGTAYDGRLDISVTSTHCVLSTNATPNHTFNDGANPFPNAFSTQADEYRVPLTPAFAAQSTPLSLRLDDAILLNGVKVDLLAAGCFGIGNGRIGCNDDTQPWRYDPMFASNGFRVDSHNAHTQPDGTYHYHGEPNALFDKSGAVASPVVGFAADGFPIYGSYIEEGGSVRKVVSSYQLKAGQRPSGDGQPGGAYDGVYRDDYEYISGAGDLDECNGMMIDGQYAYFITDAYPYVMACFKGTVDESFNK